MSPQWRRGKTQVHEDKLKQEVVKDILLPFNVNLKLIEGGGNLCKLKGSIPGGEKKRFCKCYITCCLQKCVAGLALFLLGINSGEVLFFFFFSF